MRSRHRPTAYWNWIARRERPRRRASCLRPANTIPYTWNCCPRTRKMSTTKPASPAPSRRSKRREFSSRADLAIVTLTQAYRASIAPAVTEQHIMSADYLSLVMRSMGDYSEALALNQEKIHWDISHG